MKRILFLSILLFPLWSISGPYIQINISELETNSDLICAGEITAVNVGSAELFTPQIEGYNLGTFPAEPLEAFMNVRTTFKGDAHGQIVIRCHRNWANLLFGIEKGCAVVFLKREGDHYVPANEYAFALWLDPRSYADTELSTLTELVKDTLRRGERGQIHHNVYALDQLLPKKEAMQFFRQLAQSTNDYLQGSALLNLAEKGDPTVDPVARNFISLPARDPDMRRLQEKIQRVLRD